MHVTDLAGKARPAEVSLAVVDETIYSFGEDALSSLAGEFARIAPPRRYFRKKWRSYRAQQWSANRLARIATAPHGFKDSTMEDLQEMARITRAESVKALAAAPGPGQGAARRRARLAQLGQMPVGSLAAARLRTDFSATAAWMPQLRTDAAGVARATVALPDSLTAYRLSAVSDDASLRSLCNLALARHYTKGSARAKQLWQRATALQPTSTSDIALKLMTAAAMGATRAQRRPGVAALLARKKGHRWPGTRETSWAIEALSTELSAAAAGRPARSVAVRVDGKTVLNVTDAAALRKLVHRVRMARAALPKKEALSVELRADCDEPVNFALTATGTQRLDKVDPIGTTVKMTRRYATLDGKPLGAAVRVGQVVAVHVTVDLARAQQYMIVEDRRPTGMEFAHDRLSGPAASRAAHVEFRDERLCAFFTAMPAGKHELVYTLRAETPWTGHVLPGAAYPMYSETIRGETAAARLTVVP